MDVCVVTYGNTAERIAARVRPSDRLLVHDNSTRNLGFAAGANRAAVQGDGELIAFVNPDGTPDRDCFERLDRAMEDRSVVGVEASLGAGVDRPPMDCEGNMGWVAATCMVVRRHAFEQLGGFDERLFMYYEDVDLSYRLRTIGQLRRCREAHYRHDPGTRPFRAWHRLWRNALVVETRHRVPARRALSQTLRDALGSARRGDGVMAAARLTAIADYLVRSHAWVGRPRYGSFALLTPEGRAAAAPSGREKLPR